MSLQCCNKGVETSYSSCFISFQAFEAFTSDDGTFGPRKKKVEKNLIGHKFTMVDQKCQVLQAQKVFDSNESKLEGMTHEISMVER